MVLWPQKFLDGDSSSDPWAATSQLGREEEAHLRRMVLHEGPLVSRSGGGLAEPEKNTREARQLTRGVHLMSGRGGRVAARERVLTLEQGALEPCLRGAGREPSLRV